MHREQMPSAEFEIQDAEVETAIVNLLFQICT